MWTMSDDPQSADGHDQRALSEEERQVWRLYMRVLLRLSYEMNRELLIDGGVSLADYHVLNACVGRP